MKSSRFWIFACWAYLGFLMFVSISAYLKLIPTEISQFPHYDTVLHFLLVGLAAFFTHLALKKRKVTLLNIPIPLAGILALGGRTIDETIQIFTPSRSFDLLDLGADLCGIILFLYLAEKVSIKKVSDTQS
jgi:polysaccharide biosynthesis protein VpsQ